jgi:outer membrane protein TolC
MSPSRRLLFLAVTAFCILGWAGAGFAQSAQPNAPGYSPGVNYSKPLGYWPNPLAPYTGRNVPKPNFNNSVLINQLIHEGKLMLSLNDAIALALENNLDLAIARYNLSIADVEVMRSKSGSATRGVNVGIVQNTPGGQGVGVTGGASTSGTGTGGTTSGAGGAGGGTAGLVTSEIGVGSAIDSFDPIVTGTLQLDKSKSPSTNRIITGGVNLLGSNTTTGNFTYAQGFPTGTLFTVGLDNSRQALSTSSFSLFNPQLSSTLRATVRQHLLAGFGLASNLRNIRIAKNNREESDISFRLQVVTTVDQIQNIYWDLVSAYEDVKAKERALALAQKLLTDNQKQVQIGTLAPIEVVRAQSQVASSNQDLIVSQTNLQLQQLLMKNALARNLTDPTLVSAEVIPTDTMKLPATEPVVPTEDLVNEAMGHRPELAQSQVDLTNRDISRKSARNAMLPTLDLVAWYGAQGIGGDPAVTAVARTGLDNVLNDVFLNNFPDKGIGVNLTIPIKNRNAQADQVRSELEYRQAQSRLQQLQNQIRIEVRNAQFAVQQNRARVDAAIEGRRLAQETYDAEVKKYALGASTTYNVLLTQRDLATAESSLVVAMAAYEKSRVELDRTTGRTLNSLGIEIADAESGNVKKMPSVPGVQPRTDLNQPTGTVTPQVMPQQPQQTTPTPAPQTPPPANN